VKFLFDLFIFSFFFSYAISDFVHTLDIYNYVKIYEDRVNKRAKNIVPKTSALDAFDLFAVAGLLLRRKEASTGKPSNVVYIVCYNQP